MKRFVDTNVFLRFLLADHPTMSPQARHVFERARDGKLDLYTTELVVAELEWVLRSFHKQSKEMICENISTLLACANLEISGKRILRDALTIYKEKNIDFVDAYHASLVCTNGENTLISFDQDFDKLSELTRTDPKSL